jgi:hypothetical protein
VHGVGGSAAIGVLLLASIPGRTMAALALGLFAVGTAAAMAAASTALAFALARPPVLARFHRVAPVLGAASLAFGCWFVAGAVKAPL